MSSTTVNVLKVPGARLYYEVRGSGPVLLMVPGGPTDADIFAGIAPHLTDRFTVVTYDARGNSRSELDGEPEDWRAEVHADDAHQLLSAITSTPAYVFGSSGGALVGLALAVRHSERVHTVIAHEPPATELLPDRERYRAERQAIVDTYQREGVGPAMAKFLAMAGLERSAPPPQPPTDPRPNDRAGMQRMMRNLELFVSHGMRGTYEPDIAALRAGSTRIVVLAGEESHGQLSYRASAALAEGLGTPLVHVPGDHGGFVSQPAAFAQRLFEILAAPG
jgi:pimeloyl-ACP methyl ester carboxylesterase